MALFDTYAGPASRSSGFPARVRDSAQVRTLVAELALRDRVGSLGALFAPADASGAAARAAGWILGA